MIKKLFYLSLVLLLFACKSKNTLIDSRDEEKYHFVEIKGIRWMTENMRYNIEGSKYNPDNPNELYGRLYNWHQAMEACPEGWHLAHPTSWFTIESFFITDKDELYAKGKFRGTNAKILKSKEGWSTPGTDSLGLNLLPAGRADYTSFAILGEGAFFWTSGSHMWGGQFAEEFAYYRFLYKDSLGIDASDHDKESNFYSCRCVQFIKNDKKRETKGKKEELTLEE
jgi:uncharacterized protein (TIGR02145 family)